MEERCASREQASFGQEAKAALMANSIASSTLDGSKMGARWVYTHENAYGERHVGDG